jgi:RNA polymerase sigma-70 factor (ECF subfamily)
MSGMAAGAGGWNDGAEAVEALEATPSFEEFFVDERDRLFRILCAITGSREEAEDISQDAFVRVWERWETVAVMKNRVGYLYKVAMNLVRSRYRRAVVAARRRWIANTSAKDVYEAVDDRQVVLQAVGALPPRQRAAIVLTEVMQFTAEEAGAMLGVRASSVRALHFQARSALRTSKEASDV